MFIGVGVVTLIVYFVVFSWIENRRRKSSPWEITFTELDNSPALLINHAELKLTNITIVIADAPAPTNLPQTIRFEHGQVAPLDLPIGKCIFLDTLFQPGTVVCEVFGNEIQILPRTLTINRVEYPWSTSQKILLTNRVPATLPTN